MLNLSVIKDFISQKIDLITNGRPDVLYAPRPPARRKYQTAIRAPDKNFFHLMVQRNAYLWVVVKKDLQGQILVKIQKSYQCLKGNPSFKKLPVCSSFQQCLYWVSLVQCQIVLFQDIFFQTFQLLKKYQNAVGFHIITSQNVQIAKIARQNRKIKSIYDNQEYILSLVKQNMQRFAITKQDKQTQQKISGGQQFKRILIRNIIFPNFIKLSKHDKSQHNQYRLHLIGLRKLTTDDKLASKDKFVELSRQKFPKDQDLITQYYSNEFQDPKQILRFYTLDSFFYKILNNTLRIAKNTQQFFSIGEPFNKVFDAIKKQYDNTIQKIRNPKNSSIIRINQYKNKSVQIVYRGADLTASECQYLQQNKNNYIQINGFISTSKNLQTAKNFAKQRKNKTIFQITLKQVQEKYKQFDYGYVDLQTNKCSAFDQDQVLINALNVFKISGKRKQDQFDIYQLEYGAIYEILDKDPSNLQQADKFAYYSFKQLKQMNQEVKDIGQVYLRTNQPQKAIEIYQFKLKKLNQGQTAAQKQEIQNVRIQAADAYLANGQPDKALEYYQSIFFKKRQRNGFLLNKNVIINQSKIQQDNIAFKRQTQLLKIVAKVAQTNNDMDKYYSAQQTYQSSKSISSQNGSQSSLQTLWARIDLQWQIVKGKNSQLRFEQAFNILKQIQRLCRKGLKKIKSQFNPYQQKKYKMELTKVYQSMAQIIQELQKQKQSIHDIKKSFDSVYKQLFTLIQKNSYEEGLLNLRKSQIIRRTKQFKEDQLIKSYSHSIKLIRNNTIQTNQILPKALNCFAEVQKQITRKLDNSQVKHTKMKQLKHQTMIYGQNNSHPLKTKMQIAVCDRQDRNIIQSLEKFDQAYNTKISNKNQQKYSIHAKVLYNMGQAYSDKGDDGLALKSYNQAFNILKKRLLGKDFQKSILRYKITLKIGRLYMNSSLRNQTNLTLAQRHLNQYHLFITRCYNYKHTDVAISYNCLGALYSTLKNYKESKQKYQHSIEIYEYTLGKYSIEVAKTKSNLSICYAWLKKQSKATQTLLESEQICSKIYGDLRKINPFQYQSQYIKSQIQTIFGHYQSAIQSCQKSIQLQKIYLLSKQKKKKHEQVTNFYQTNQNKYESYYLGVQMRNNAQYNSLVVNKAVMNSMTPTKLQSHIPKMRSEDPIRRYQQINTTQHTLKCEFKICECLLYLKRYEEAKKKIQQLQKNLNKRIIDDKKTLDKRGNPLFKDNLHSKKLFYYKKTQQYMQKVIKALKLKAKKQNNQQKNNNQNQQIELRMQREIQPQNFDNY